MKHKKVFVKAGILLLSLLLVPGMVGCETISNIMLPTVSEDEVFHTIDKIDVTYGGSKNITVEQLPDGMRITGTERAAIVKIGTTRFELGPDPENSEFKASVLGLKVDSKSGNIILIVSVDLGSNSSVLALAPQAYPFDPKSVGFLPGAPKSENVSIKINSSVGYTEVAGLRFKDEVVIRVWENGTVELDRENVVVSDMNGQQWISRRVRIGEQTAILVIKK